MKHAYISAIGIIILSLSVIPCLNGQTYEEEVLADDPVVYFRFEEDDEATDSSGFDNIGEYMGGIEFDQPSAEEGLGNAIRLDGQSGFIQMTPMDLETDQVTIEAWVNLELLAGGCCTSIFSPDGWQQGWLHYNLRGDGNIEFALNGGGPNNHNTAPGTVPFGEWTHIASVYDRDEATVRTFVNGEEVDVSPPDFSTPQTVLFQVNAQVGAWQNTRFLGGLLDEFAIYDTALSEDRILDHFEAATAPLPPAGDQFVRGDADGDGSVAITDAVRVLNFLFLGEAAPPCDSAADADDNGSIAITDPVRVLNFLFSGGDAPAAPHPECGVDPTEDELTCDSFEPCA